MFRSPAIAVVVLIALGSIDYFALHPAHSQGATARALGSLPPSYWDLRLISVARKEGKHNAIRATFWNHAAIKALSEGKFPFPEGAIIARLAWEYIPSGEDNKAFGQPQSFFARAATNVQFMVKDSAKYAASGGSSLVPLDDGKLGNPADLGACFASHVPVEARD